MPATPLRAHGEAGVRSLRVGGMEREGEMQSAPEGVCTNQQAGEATLFSLWPTHPPTATESYPVLS